eukprot:11905763-Ditylum_brightwellii.AAC.1
MNGFSQYPLAYYTMSKNVCNTAGVAILAVNTGLMSNTVLSNNMKANFAGMLPHFLLQHMVLEDTKQLIQMLQEEDGKSIPQLSQLLIAAPGASAFHKY